LYHDGRIHKRQAYNKFSFIPIYKEETIANDTKKANSTTEVAIKPMLWWVPEPMRCVVVDPVPSIMDELLTAKPIKDIQTFQ
jgi:hypothetical protein